jgi:hypothetical protein
MRMLRTLTLGALGYGAYRAMKARRGRTRPGSGL